MNNGFNQPHDEKYYLNQYLSILLSYYYYP